MLISRIRIENFLSYKEMEWHDVDPRLNVIVGPNGAGKTNLFHAVRAIADINAGRNTDLWQQASHRGSNPAYRIDIDVEWNSKWEREVLTSFIGAALADDRSLGSVGIGALSPASYTRFSQFVLSQLSQAWVSPFFRGQLTLEYEGVNRWRTYYSVPGLDVPLGLGLGASPGSMLYSTNPGGGTRPFVNEWMTSLAATGPEHPSLVAYIQQGGTEPHVKFPEWSTLVKDVNVSLQVWAPQYYLPTHKDFQQITGITLTGSDIGARQVFQRLLEARTVITQNVRRVPRRQFPTQVLSRAQVDLEDGELLALHLFLLRSGPEPDPSRYAQIEQTFRSLTGRAFDVRAGAAGQPTEISLAVWIIDDGQSVPLEFSGAGITEALLLSATMAGEDRVIFLDEPALNLHPLVQARLGSELSRQTTRQFFVTTHSQILVVPSAIGTTSRFYRRGGSTRRAGLAHDPEATKQVATLEKELRRSSDARGLLFASGVILVEGETELGALPVWYEKRFHAPIEEADITVYSVGGDRGFRTYVQFLTQFDVPWAIVCDRPAIFDSIPSLISSQLRSAGIEVGDEAELTEEGRLALLATNGAFCFLKPSEKEFDDLPVIREHWKDAAVEVGTSKVRVGRYISEQYDCPQEVASVLERVRDYLNQKM